MKRYEFMSVDEFKKRIYDAYWLENEDLGNEIAFLFIDNRLDGLSLKTENDVEEYCDKKNLIWYGIVKRIFLGSEYVIMSSYGITKEEYEVLSENDLINGGREKFYETFDLFAKSNYEFGNGILMEIAE